MSITLKTSNCKRKLDSPVYIYFHWYYHDKGRVLTTSLYFPKCGKETPHWCVFLLLGPSHRAGLLAEASKDGVERDRWKRMFPSANSFSSNTFILITSLTQILIWHLVSWNFSSFLGPSSSWWQSTTGTTEGTELWRSLGKKRNQDYALYQRYGKSRLGIWYLAVYLSYPICLCIDL